MQLEVDGAERMAGAALAALPRLAQALPGDGNRAGVRLHGDPDLAELLGSRSVIGRLAASAIGQPCRPVRAILFDKNRSLNWALGWHQDRTIAVAERRDVPGFGSWTVKQGMIHVEPPFDIIESMFTLRVHFDGVPLNNAPLRIAPGSHRFGRIAEPEIPNIVERCGEAVCTAEAGDIWIYRAAILHASDAAACHGRRRVLQVDYSAMELPGGLQWLGI